MKPGASLFFVNFALSFFNRKVRKEAQGSQGSQGTTSCRLQSITLQYRNNTKMSHGGHTAVFRRQPDAPNDVLLPLPAE